MKKKIISVFVVLGIICTLAGCGQPKHQHTWVEATCSAPKHCSECGETEGIALPHEIGQWEVVVEATCTESGVQQGTCLRCGETITEQVPIKEHTLGEWEITKEATYDSPGEKVQKCTVCGSTVYRESFELSAEEKESFYKASCEWIPYKDLARNPDEYKGRPVAFTGEVVQVLEGDVFNVYRIDVTQTYYGIWEDTVYVSFKGTASGGRVLEDDIVTFYGTYLGLQTYETIFGASVTIPSVWAEYIDINLN